MTAAPVPVTVLVDPVRCDAFGYCAELLPERIALDEWGYPIVDGTPVPERLVAAAAEAARQCPRRALVVLDAARRPRR